MYNNAGKRKKVKLSEMIQYPNGKKDVWQPKLHSASQRGMNLEKDLNTTNAYYLGQDIAVIHKKPTPVQIVHVDYPRREAAKITEAYFKVPSTTDYNGIYKGRYIDFEAKECQAKTSFPLKMLFAHQITHLKSVVRHGGIAFLVVRFTSMEVTFLADAEKVALFNENGGRASIPYSWFLEHAYPIDGSYAKPVDYLKVVDKIYLQ